MNITGKDFAWVIAVDNVPLSLVGRYHIYTSKDKAEEALEDTIYRGGTPEIRKVKLVVL